MNTEKIDHIGIAVESIEDKLKLYRDVLGLKFSNVESLENRGLKVYFVEIGETRLEFLEPLSENSEISRFLEKKGEGIHHIAFKVKDVEKTVEDCEKNGFKVIAGIQKGAEGKKVAFLHPKTTGGVLIELVES
ncbi:MAG: methylmalonyl-CoA/ethylmalonyl-CoA epimerase [Thermotogaceae bacterium]|nr:methylmalonyl-CoA/ethylmalonyl-CoA epimerase [Thermotogaceae bacterium]MDN5337992.1 methylmalonyl-CoA/ethylmalonyl-CoA epimerase [Thermotogaceae bacterium]